MWDASVEQRSLLEKQIQLERFRQAATKAVMFTFPHRGEELRQWGDYMVSEFSANNPMHITNLSCKEAIPLLVIPGCGCAPSGIPRAVTSVTVVTLVPFSLHSHYVSISTIYIGLVYSCVISLITPPPPLLQIAFNKAVQAMVRGWQAVLLTDHDQFTYLYSAYLLPDGIQGGSGMWPTIRE